MYCDKYYFSFLHDYFSHEFRENLVSKQRSHTDYIYKVNFRARAGSERGELNLFSRQISSRNIDIGDDFSNEYNNVAFFRIKNKHQSFLTVYVYFDV